MEDCDDEEDQQQLPQPHSTSTTILTIPESAPTGGNNDTPSSELDKFGEILENPGISLGCSSNLKLSGFDFWQRKLGKARHVLAPMVEQSELAWRLLSRRHGAELCYTPMIHASLFVKDRTYRKDNFITCPQDRPLIAQFCGNKPEVLVEAAKLVAPMCDGIDLNLGCPQTIAKRGFYGAFLQDHWDLIFEMVRAVHTEVSVPITCKMRIFKDLDKTVRYAQMLERAGCQLLAVHGRTREQKGPDTGLANWDHIKAVKESVSIPVLANGNIQVHEDIHKCLEYTEAHGIMVAEGNLHNPGLFQEGVHITWEMGLEYLDLVKEYPCSPSCIRAHLFKIFHFSLWEFPELRPVLGKAGSLEEFRGICERFRDLSLDDYHKYLSDPSSYDCRGLSLPHWYCQPYYRPGVGRGMTAEPELVEEQRKERRKRRHQELDSKVVQTGLSKRRLRKLIRYPDKEFTEVYQKTNYRSNRTQYVKCSCGNPIGGKCCHKMCRNCCKKFSHQNAVNCESHKFWFKNIAERRKLAAEQTQNQNDQSDTVSSNGS